jgi:hypothetical protein
VPSIEAGQKRQTYEVAIRVSSEDVCLSSCLVDEHMGLCTKGREPAGDDVLPHAGVRVPHERVPKVCVLVHRLSDERRHPGRVPTISQNPVQYGVVGQRHLRSRARKVAVHTFAPPRLRGDVVRPHVLVSEDVPSGARTNDGTRMTALKVFCVTVWFAIHERTRTVHVPVHDIEPLLVRDYPAARMTAQVRHVLYGARLRRPTKVCPLVRREVQSEEDVRAEILLTIAAAEHVHDSLEDLNAVLIVPAAERPRRRADVRHLLRVPLLVREVKYPEVVLLALEHVCLVAAPTHVNAEKGIPFRVVG